jgi:hypothetical protein
VRASELRLVCAFSTTPVAVRTATVVVFLNLNSNLILAQWSLASLSDASIIGKLDSIDADWIAQSSLGFGCFIGSQVRRISPKRRGCQADRLTPLQDTPALQKQGCPRTVEQIVLNFFQLPRNDTVRFGQLNTKSEARCKLQYISRSCQIQSLYDCSLKSRFP